MAKKLVRDDDQAREAFAPAVLGADREPEGPALGTPNRRDRKRDPTELARWLRLRDGYGHEVPRRTRFGVG